MIRKKLEIILKDNSPYQELGYNLISFQDEKINSNQKQTRDSFSNKWDKIDYNDKSFKELQAHSTKWYLDLYGFKSEREFQNFLKNKKIILDAGCGVGHKAAWMAKLSPNSLVIAADISESIFSAAKYYRNLKNIIWVKGNIMNMPYFKDESFDYVSCDQVIMHTTQPYETFKELNRTTKKGGELSVYVYKKKALPRELLDDHFRIKTKDLSDNQLTEFSEQLTELGKILSKQNLELTFPDIPLLGIKGGKMDIQRFIYWNFIKCFWDDKLGYKNSFLINYDWYAPSQAERYTREEFKNWISSQDLKELYFHEENACYSGRFIK